MTRFVQMMIHLNASTMAKVLIMCWVVVMTLMCTVMMGRHSIPLPAQKASDQQVASALGAHRTPSQADRWMMVHVFFSSCPCSRRLAEYLVAGQRPEDLAEHVLLVGDDPEWRARAQARGLSVHVIEPEELDAFYHLQAAPLLVVLDPLDRVRYLGGYTTRKQGIGVQDLEILQNVRQDITVEALPLFGCAVSRELRRIVDPTGWF